MRVGSGRGHESLSVGLGFVSAGMIGVGAGKNVRESVRKGRESSGEGLVASSTTKIDGTRSLVHYEDQRDS